MTIGGKTIGIGTLIAALASVATAATGTIIDFANHFGAGATAGYVLQGIGIAAFIANNLVHVLDTAPVIAPTGSAVLGARVASDPVAFAGAPATSPAPVAAGVVLHV